MSGTLTFEDFTLALLDVSSRISVHRTGASQAGNHLYGFTLEAQTLKLILETHDYRNSLSLQAALYVNSKTKEHPSYTKPRLWQAIVAALLSNESSHTVPHVPL